MSCQCSHCHSYRADQRDGTGRFNRLIQALDPISVKPDDRNLEDLLVFLKRYANQIRFYPTPSEETGEIYTWKTFFDQDQAVLLASILVTDTLQEEKDYLESREKLYAKPSLKDFADLFNPILGMARQLDNWLALSDSRVNSALQTELELLIRSDLAAQLLKLFQYAKGVEATKLKEIKLDFKPQVSDIWNINTQELIGDYSIYYFDQEQNPDLEEESDEDKVGNMLIRASWYIDDVFQAFKQGMENILLKSEKLFAAELNEHPDHQPHMALLIAFLQLFKFLQNDLNQLPKRHLDFFYREVLQLKEKPAQADQVYAVFELAKGVADYIVLPNTAATAGNDALGVERIYRTTPEMPLVINRAQVAQLKNLFLNRDENSGSIATYFANPVANSADGLGTAFKNPNSSFDTFGVGGRDEEVALTLCNYRQQQQLIGNPARLGFAIASPQLLLGGGTRTIVLEIEALKTLIAKIAPSNPNVLFDFWLTGEKGWVKIPVTNVGLVASPDINNPTITSTSLGHLKIILSDDFQKIVPFNPDQHPGDAFATKNPVLKIEVKEKLGVEWEKDLVLDRSFKLTTNVTGLKDLVLQNSLQRVENDKTFALFTQLPTKNAPFYIGSKEVFSKNISSKTITVNFNSTPAPALTPTELYWNGTQWLAFPAPFTRRFNLLNNEFSGSPQDGFFKLALNETFTTVSAASQRGLELQADSVSLNYTSTLTLNELEEGIDQFFHLYPFGILETFPTKNSGDRQIMENITKGQFVDTQVPGSEAAPRWYLLPQFFFGNRYDVNVLTGARTQYNQMTLQEGHLFIGVKDVLPLQTLSLLFQFEEGSQAEDEIPGTLHWSYLSDNAWKPLSSERILTDTTYGLQTTGIAIFDLPADVSTRHTLMPADLVWLCATVDSEPDRFPRLISVQAQAALLTLDDQSNDPAHYRNSLPAGSIAQLQERVAEVKSLKQPYGSFGGVPTQSGNDFYLAASERIRHKGRAVTIWDYEHLVLERFPEIFKVKALPYLDPRCLCRNESKLEKCPPTTAGSTEDTCCEGPQTAPGNVLLVAIPDFRQRVGNRLKPKNSNRVLRSIEQYLGNRVNPFTTVQVKNPEYEEVLTSFRVQFMPGIDKGKFLRILNEDLIRFLTPWAFENETALLDIRFDTRIYASEIINFIEERSYVDFITDFQLFHCHADCCSKQQSEELIPVKGKVTLLGVPQEDEHPQITIQLLGTSIETTIQSEEEFTLLVSEGMSLLFKADGYETKVFTYKKKPENPNELDWYDAFDDDDNQNTKLDINLNLVNTATEYKIKTVNKLDNSPIETKNILPNLETTLNPPGYQPKQIITKAADQTIMLMPLVIPELKVKVTDAKDPAAVLEDLMINVLGDPDKGSIKIDASTSTLTEVKTGSQLLIRAKNYVPRVVLIEEDELVIASPDVTLSTELLPDRTDCLENCDDLIEFWEDIRNTYLPGLNGAEIAVAPSNPRAILVSVDQHWIDLYETPAVVDPCAPQKDNVAPSTTPNSPGSSGGGTLPTNPGYKGPRKTFPWYNYNRKNYIDERFRFFYEKWVNFQELRVVFETYQRIPGVIDPIEVSKTQFETNAIKVAIENTGLVQNRFVLENGLINQTLVNIPITSSADLTVFGGIPTGGSFGLNPIMVNPVFNLPGNFFNRGRGF